MAPLIDQKVDQKARLALLNVIRWTIQFEGNAAKVFFTGHDYFRFDTLKISVAPYILTASPLAK